MKIKSLMKDVAKIFFKKYNHILVHEDELVDLLFVRRLKKIFAEYFIDCVIDVGANVGQYAKFLREKVGYKGLIISFEPEPDNFKKLLVSSRHDDRWVVFNDALGSQEGELCLNVMEAGDLNSFLQPNHDDTDELEKLNVIKSIIKVPVKKLDDLMHNFIEDNDIRNVFLKLDTQGFDLEVFKGALHSLDVIKGVQTEVSVLPIYMNMPSFDDSLKLFRKNGFEVSGLYSLSEDRFPHAIEFDCIYLPK